MKPLLSLFLLLCLTACETTSTGPSGAAKPGAKEIAVFQWNSPPDKKYTVLRTLKDDATEQEEDEITKEFIKQARKLGGDAILFHEKKQSGMEAGPFSFGKLNFTYLYKVDVIRFE